jgi:hypothetical protein
MKTLQSGQSPGSRLEAGQQVIERAKSVNPTPVKKRFDSFTAIHKLYAAAQAKVTKADLALRKQQAKLAEADVRQDEAIARLAAQLPADGLPRMQPFKPFGFTSPSVLQQRQATDEAKLVQKLGAAVLKHKAVSATTKGAASAAVKAADGVVTASAPIAKLKSARTNAMQRRDALEQAWETAFAALKRSVKTAEDDGAKGLFAALFDAKPKAKRATKQPKDEPSASMPSSPPPA